ncbi:hypothetical protein MAIT1_03618 [Magnetofaba australis IT-1]|uniref:CHAT domain-containing protein n=1 Tax=Magnetofaba australis IT-1 TaxID=1434232 RepID=A0A1Y2K3Y2_9PROT|nr:hypothetical protein MAIT1_03618 [Magnetofaba australis IT-1]
MLAGLILLSGCAAPVTLPPVAVLPDAQPATSVAQTLQRANAAANEGAASRAIARLQRGLALAQSKPARNQSAPAALTPPAYAFHNLPYVPPPLDKARIQKAGEQHIHGFTITPQWEQASRAHYAGRPQEALRILEKIRHTAASPNAMVWRATHLSIRLHMAQGEIPQAEALLDELAKLEIAHTGTNAGSRALRAELKMWAGDLDGAIADAVQVAQSIGTWSLPVSYGGPPANMSPLVNLTEAQQRALTVVGASDMLQGRYDTAIPWLEAAAELANDAFHVFSHGLYGMFIKPFPEAFYGRANALALLATCRLASGAEPSAVAPLYERARAYFAAIHYQPGPALTQMLTAKGLLAGKRYAAAVAAAQEAVVLAEQAQLRDYVWRIESLRGWALWRDGRKADAEAAARRAQSVVEEISGGMTADEDKIRFGGGKEEITRLLIAIDRDKGDYAALFDDVERSRARAFVDMLAQRSVASGRQSAITTQIRRLDGEIRQLRRARFSMLADAQSGDEAALLAERRQWLDKLSAADPELAQAFGVSTSSLADVQSRLHAGQAMAYFLPTAEAEPLAWLWITPQEVTLQQAALTADQTQAALALFNTARLMDESGYEDQADALGVDADDDDPMWREEQALRLIAQGLNLAAWQAPEGLLAVPSGVAHFLPWGALDVAFPVAVLPTGGWIVRTTESPTATGAAAIVGDPEFGGLLTPLPGARREAGQLGELYHSAPLIGPAATEAALRAKLQSGVETLHLATHALFDSAAPLESALILSDGKQADPLSAADLYANPLKARIVALSACETGLGRIAAGEDLLGLARSFYLGGTRALLSSLWTVEDQATALFMQTFHQRRLAGEALGASWLAAVQAVKAAGHPPSAYGAFILGGAL